MPADLTRVANRDNEEHWSNGGETSLGNLLLLCTKHHTLVHVGTDRDANYRSKGLERRPHGSGEPTFVS
jgi:hypothetical protein